MMCSASERAFRQSKLVCWTEAAGDDALCPSLPTRP
jgi:hypothetical protein